MKKKFNNLKHSDFIGLEEEKFNIWHEEGINANKKGAPIIVFGNIIALFVYFFVVYSFVSEEQYSLTFIFLISFLLLLILFVAARLIVNSIISNSVGEKFNELTKKYNISMEDVFKFLNGKIDKIDVKEKID